MNYQIELQKIMDEVQGTKKLLLHSCCAPCSSYVLEYLSNYFDITVFYYNPNISNEEEYQKRLQEQKRLITCMNKSESIKHRISFLAGEYCPQEFFALAKGLEEEKEGGERCSKCFTERLQETARTAKEKGFSFFTTTLTISPLKNAAIINEIGCRMAEKYGVPFLPSDFKKKNGYKRSVELSKEYDLYRQDYCGCIFSKMQREKDGQE